MGNGEIRTFADGFGIWHAVVPVNDGGFVPDVEALAASAIFQEVMLRQRVDGDWMPAVELYRVEVVAGEGGTVVGLDYREV